MSDFTHINQFRKGAVVRTVNEDPTYLSFSFLFDTVDREHSPLFAGPAKEYLTKFVDDWMDTKYAVRLEAFQNVLLKINREMPWFFSKINGLELTETYGKMQEPWRGSESPKIEIECLEENIELTAIGLMSLYKNAVYDYQRFVEILPKNLRHFRVWIIVSEVRTFQQDKTARDKNLFGANMAPTNDTKSIKIFKNRGAESGTRTGAKFNPDVTNFSAESMPFIKFELNFCEWQQDSIADMLADLSKQAEMKKPKISFTWQKVHVESQKFGPNITSKGELDENLIPPTPLKPADGLYPDQPFNPFANAQNAIADKVNGIAGSMVNRFNNIKDSLPGVGNNPLGAVYPKRLTGPLASAADALVNAGMNRLKRMLSDNVHGFDKGLDIFGSVQDALAAGSINGLANLGFKYGMKNSKREYEKGANNVYDSEAVDSTPDGSMNSNVYDSSPVEQNQPISPGRIHEPGIDSSPDGNLNDNVYK